MSGDILTYVQMQNELDYGTEEPPSSPRLPLKQPQPNNLMQLPQTGLPISSNSFGPTTAGQGLRVGNSDQRRFLLEQFHTEQ
ncbi:hypothetical protein AAHA92_25135 [Salvia divinorum]|uniref:Uncharacterized protein n=1 Tax=Salvia divinorum TaxID=28513 RepID=A0ABD1GAB8_SALDI